MNDKVYQGSERHGSPQSQTNRQIRGVEPVGGG